MLSAPTKPTSLMVVLPSIREMFPEHLMDIPPPLKATKPMSYRRPLVSHLQQGWSQSRPRSLSASSSTYNHGPSYSQRPQPPHMPHAPQNRPHAHVAPPTAPPTPHTPYVPHAGTSPASNPHTHSPKNNPDSSTYSFGVLRSDPSSSSLQHITSSSTFPNRGATPHGNHTPAEVTNGSSPAFQVALSPSSMSSETPSVNIHQSRSFEQPQPSNAPPAPSIISFPVSGTFSGPFSLRDRSPDDSGSDEGDLAGSNSGKKHICTTCFKRFNRPSSLRIHVNTHTGATPFRCPWPNCGREFNVNSNMRRHLRNHSTPGFSRSHSDDSRRRRRRVVPPQPVAFMNTSVSPTISHSPTTPRSYVPSPPISTITMSEDSDDDPMEVDELVSPNDEPSPRHPTHRLSRSHTRSFPGSGYRPAAMISLSPSPQPEPVYYSPSAPYVQSFADLKVSTALRPAFHPAPAPTARPVIKDEPRPGSW